MPGIVGWLNTNEGRAYPLRDVAARIAQRSDGFAFAWPDSVFVDYRADVAAETLWIDGADVAYLAKVERRLDGDWRFFVEATAAGTTGWNVIFNVPNTAPEFASFEAEATLGFASSQPGVGACGTDFLWSALLTIGRLDRLALAVPPGFSATVAAGLLAFEPTLTRNRAGSEVRSLSLANAPRTAVPPRPGCPNDTPLGSTAYATTAFCISGVVTLRPGYNCTISQDVVRNRLTIGAAVGAGLGEPCAEVPLSPTEKTRAGSKFFGGGPGCGDVVSSVNGLSAPYIQLQTTPGVRATVDPLNPSRLFIIFDTTVLPSGRSFHDSSI